MRSSGYRAFRLSMLLLLLGACALASCYVPSNGSPPEARNVDRVVATSTAPKYLVTIVFEGLMNYETGTNRVDVMIPKVATSTLGDDDHEVHEHIAYILTDTASMLKTDPINLGHTFVPAANEGAKYHYLPLAGEYITLEAANQVSAINPKLVYKTDGTLPCPDANSQTSLIWLSSVKAIRGGNPTKEKKYFDPWPLAKDVSARAILQYGHLDAHVIDPGVIWGFGKPDKFKKPKLKNPQALAEEVHWTFEAQEEPFVLSLVGFDGVARRVAFKPQSGKLLIFIANTPANETGPVPPTAEAIDKHYSVYHTLVQGNAKGKGRIPHDTEKKCTAFLFPQTLKPTAIAIADKGTTTATSTAPLPSGLNCSGTRWP
jgi:hypothetical protein